MKVDANSHAYSAAAKGFHWLVALLLAVQFMTAFLLPHIGRNTPSSTIITLHFSFGILVMLVMAIRFAHRLKHPMALEASGATPWDRLFAVTVHRLFYVILLGFPVLGWASASAHKLPVSLFGIVALPAIVQPGSSWANSAGDVHSAVMWALLWLIGVHVAAALYHHLFRHDGTLRRMLPSRKR